MLGVQHATLHLILLQPNEVCSVESYLTDKEDIWTFVPQLANIELLQVGFKSQVLAWEKRRLGSKRSH